MMTIAWTFTAAIVIVAQQRGTSAAVDVAPMRKHQALSEAEKGCLET
jgi:hypothetical protein